MIIQRAQLVQYLYNMSLLGHKSGKLTVGCPPWHSLVNAPSGDQNGQNGAIPSLPTLLPSFWAKSSVRIRVEHKRTLTQQPALPWRPVPRLTDKSVGHLRLLQQGAPRLWSMLISFHSIKFRKRCTRQPFERLIVLPCAPYLRQESLPALAFEA
jgi:hypothetical protein